MLAELITLTPGRRNEFMDSQKAKVRIAVLSIMSVRKHWNLTLEFLERAYRLQEFTREWLQNPKYREYRPLFTTKDDWMILKYVMDILMPFWYYTMWMLKRHPVTLHHVITVYNDMFHHMDGVMWGVVKKKTQWQEDLYFTMKLAQQKLSKYHAEVTPTLGMPLISAHILDPFRKLQSFRKWGKGINMNPEDEASYTAQYQGAFVMYMENEYCAKHRHVPVIKSESVLSNNLFHSAMASRAGQSSFDAHHLPSDDGAYLMPNIVAETTPGTSDHPAPLMTTAMLYLKSPPESTRTWGQVNPNLNDYHSDPIEISRTFCIPDITDVERIGSTDITMPKTMM